MANIITNSAELVPGWYAVGMKNLDGDIEWGGALLAEYVGSGQWVTEGGDSVDRVWDAELQLYVGINDADGYVRQ